MDVLAKRKLFFEQHLAGCLDALLCAQLIIVYLNDTSTFRLILGFVLEIAFLTPRIPGMLMPQISRRKILLSIFAYNLWSLVMHSVFGPPKSNSPQSDYLHGGWTIEFIGEHELNSRIPLILWDLVVMCVQLVLYAVHYPPERVLGSEETEGGNENEPLSDISAYSGNAIVKDICIVQAIIEGWNKPVETTESSDVSDAEDENETGVPGEGTRPLSDNQRTTNESMA